MASIYTDNLLNDFWEFHLVLIGVYLSIFTLVYSLIIGKRQELKLMSEQIKKEGKSPLVNQKEHFAVDYIRRLKKLNKYIVVLLITSIVLFLFNWISLRLIGNKKIPLIIIGIITIVLCICFVILFMKFYKHYKTETKI
jgi:ABC-type bacteriocin/lantibiotic exporter with double-glycine peptidase domain